MIGTLLLFLSAKWPSSTISVKQRLAPKNTSGRPDFIQHSEAWEPPTLGIPGHSWSHSQNYTHDLSHGKTNSRSNSRSDSWIWFGEKLKGSLLKGSFDKRVRIDLTVPLPVPTPPRTLPTPFPLFLIFPQENHPPPPT